MRGALGGGAALVGAEGEQRGVAGAGCTEAAVTRGSAPNYGAWMAALEEVTDLNRAYFGQSVTAGRGELTGRLPLGPWAVAPGRGADGLGLRPRTAEFR
ncbi:hypothetical protein ACWCY6_42195 [Streptomyces sp. 900105755]